MLNANAVVYYQPDEMVGKDGVNYRVLTVFTGGRGWAGKMYYNVDQGKKLKVKIIEADSAIKNLYKVEILDSDYRMRHFSKNPYVRKDGTFNHVYNDETPHKLFSRTKNFFSVYGVSHEYDYNEETQTHERVDDRLYMHLFIKPKNIKG